MKIAAAENNSHRTSSIFTNGVITIYEGEESNWKVAKSFENRVCNAQGIAAVRKSVTDIIKNLDDVKIIATSEISGVAFSLFEAAGFEIFIADSEVKNVLAGVWKEISKLNQEQNGETADIMAYLESGMNEGDFCLNMMKILADNPQFTSKSLLLPYLRNGSFKRLDVVCSHLPPWFDKELNSLGLRYETVRVLPDQKTVRILHM